MLETKPAGYYALELDDLVEHPHDGSWGNVVNVPGLDGPVILWPETKESDRSWDPVHEFEQECRVNQEPYRIKRQDWDFELLQDGTFNEYLDAADDG